MKTCPTCGSEMWNYNTGTLTCKNGHRWTLDGTATGEQPVFVRASAPAPVAATELTLAKGLVALCVGSGAMAAVVIEVLFKLLG